jgi:thiamine pyrophosphokinase
MERVMKLDIKVDVLLGDFDGDFDPSIMKKQYPLEIVHTQIKTKQILKSF